MCKNAMNGALKRRKCEFGGSTGMTARYLLIWFLKKSALNVNYLKVKIEKIYQHIVWLISTKHSIRYISQGEIKAEVVIFKGNCSAKVSDSLLFHREY